MGIVTRWFGRRKRWFSRKRNKVPAYVITKSGIRVNWINPNAIEEMPFDMDTYGNQQVFVEDYATPIKINIEDIEKTMDGNDIITSSKYKTYMGQRVLSQVFRGSGFEPKKLMYLIFANIGLTVLLGLISIVVLLQ